MRFEKVRNNYHLGHYETVTLEVWYGWRDSMCENFACSFSR